MTTIMITTTITFDTERERNFYITKLFKELLTTDSPVRRYNKNKKEILKVDGMEDIVLES